MTNKKSHSLRTLIIVSTLFWFQMGVIGPVQSLFFRRLGLTVSQIGFVMMFNALGWAIFEPIFGILADRYDRKKLILFSTFFTSIIYLLYVSANNILHLILILFSLSSVRAPAAVSMRSLFTELLPISERGKTYGRYMAVMSLGGIVAPLIGGYLANFVSYNAPFYLSALLGFVTTIIGLFITIPKKSIISAENISFFDRRFLNKQLIKMLCIRLLYMFNMNVQRTIIPIYFKENTRFNATEMEIGLFFGISRLFSFFANLFLGKLTDRFSIKYIITFGLSIIGLSYLPLTYMSGIYSIYFLSMLQGVFFALTNMGMMLYLITMIPVGASGRVMGLYGLSEDLGGMIASMSLGLIYDLTTPIVSILLVSLVMIFNSILSFTILKKDNKKQVKHVQNEK